MVRLSAEEALLLAFVRSLSPERREYAVEILQHLFEAEQKTRPSNVVLLSDPFRKFRR
jgi:hypothetical protein